MAFFCELRVYSFLIGRAFDVFSSGMIMMALPWLMLKQGVSGTWVALVALACTLSAFVLTPIFATWIDRCSRKSLMVGVQATQSSMALLLYCIGLAGDISFFWMAVAQWVFWVSNDLGWATSNALVQENFTSKEYPKISSLKEVIGQSVMISAGAAGVLLLESWSMQAFALFATVCSAMGLILFSLMPYRRSLRQKNHSKFFQQMLESREIIQRNRSLMLFFALSCLSYPMITFLIKLVPIYLMEYGYSGNWFAIWKTVQGTGAICCGIFAVLLLQRFKEEHLMVYATWGVAILLAVMGLFLQPIVLVATTLVFGFCTTLNRIARIKAMNLTVEVNERGRVDGVLTLFSTFAQSLSYVLIAILAHYHLVEYGFLIMALIMAIAATGMRVLQKGLCVNCGFGASV